MVISFSVGFNFVLLVINTTNVLGFLHETFLF